MMNDHIGGVALLFSLAISGAVPEEPDRHPGETTSGMVKVEESGARTQPVIPIPQEMYWGKGEFDFDWTIERRGHAASLSLISTALNQRLKKRSRTRRVYTV
jgi:hypothetical protein